MEKNSGTRSGLLWEVERLLNECTELPQILLMENVPQVHGSKNKVHFDEWIEFLESKGYTNYWQDLNAKNYGIPQNRNRCFMVSVLDNKPFEFPKPFELKLKLKDMLEDEVDEKYYLSTLKEFFIKNSFDNEAKGNGFRFEPHIKQNANIAKTITTRAGGRMDDNFILEDIKSEQEKFKFDSTNKLIVNGNKSLNETLEKNVVEPYDFIDSYNRSVRKDEIAGTITTRVDASNCTYICIPEKTKKGYAEATEGDGVYINRPHQKRGCVQKDMIQTIKTSPNDVGVVVKDTRNMKERLCDELLEKGLVKENDVIRHSYTTSRMKGEMKDIQENNISPTLDTRCDCLGVVVKGEINVIGNYSPSGHDASRIVHPNGISPTVKENHDTVTATVVPPLRIRKLTPKECWRLMGFSDTDFDKAAQFISNAQLYKQAGNSIVVDVLENIFRELFLKEQDISSWLDKLLEVS